MKRKENNLCVVVYFGNWDGNNLSVVDINIHGNVVETTYAL